MRLHQSENECIISQQSGLLAHSRSGNDQASWDRDYFDVQFWHLFHGLAEFEVFSKGVF